MKNILVILFLISAALASCTKEYNYDPYANQNTGNGNNGGNGGGNNSGYGSLKDFYAANEVKSQTFSGDIANGIFFTTAAGTQVAIPPNAFVTLNGDPVTGQVDIQFKDIYKKSDMLLSNVPTMTTSGAPLKSGGEFWIKATSNGAAVKLAPGYTIAITQPLNGLSYDPDMEAFVSPVGVQNWEPAQNAIMIDSGYLYSNYIYSLFQFSSPEDSGSWCNSDNETYFSAYPQTTFTVQPSFDVDSYFVDVYLVFSDINSMVHVYQTGNNFTYSYAPEGLSCTAVVVAIKDSLMYSSFTPVVIGTNETVDVNVNGTSEAEFEAQLDALN